MLRCRITKIKCVPLSPVWQSSPNIQKSDMTSHNHPKWLPINDVTAGATVHASSQQTSCPDGDGYDKTHRAEPAVTFWTALFHFLLHLDLAIHSKVHIHYYMFQNIQYLNISATFLFLMICDATLTQPINQSHTARECPHNTSSPIRKWCSQSTIL